MAEISQENKERLFKVPVIKRDEPRVAASDVVINKGSQLKKEENALRDFAKEVGSLLDGYTRLGTDYQKLIDVLTTRANLLGMSLSIGDYPNDQQLSNALVTLYGSSDVNNISFSEYVDLLKYEQTTAGAYVATTVNLENAFDDVNELLNKDFTDNPVIGAIGVVKQKFNEEILDSSYPQLHIVELLVQRLAEAESSYSSVSEMDKLADGERATENDGDNPGKKDKLEELINDCIPCMNRSFGLAEDFRKGDMLQAYIDLMFQKFFANLKELARLKLSILGTYFSKDICRIIKMLGNYICVPDLMAIVTLLKAVLMKYKKLLEVEFENISIGMPAAPIGMLINTGLDALLMLLTKLFSTIFSSIECVLASLQIQLSKLGIDADLGAEDVNDAAQDFYTTLRKGKTDLEAQFYAVVEQITKKLRFNVLGSGDAIDILDQIENASSYLSLVSEILSIKEAYNESSEAGFWDRMGKAICVAAYGSKYPWLEVIDEWIDDLTDGGSTPTPPGGGTTTTGDPSTPTDGTDGEDGGGITIGDGSLPIDIFDDDPIDLLDDDYWKEYWKNLGYRYNPENGDDIIVFDESLLNKYKNTKNRLLRNHTALNASDSIEGRTSLPVIRLDFSKCLEAHNLDGFDASEINEWINKINS